MRSKWVWLVTLANAFTVIFLVFLIFELIIMLGVLAPEIDDWPLYAVLPVGVVLSIVALKLANSAESKTSRRIAYCLNGLPLTLYVFMIACVASLSIGGTREKFIIPNGYQGDVYVIHSAANGKPAERVSGTIVYRIPTDGVLQTQEPFPAGWTKPKYYYEHSSGSLQLIKEFWPSTIPSTPENLNNNRDIGIYFLRTGSTTLVDQNCQVEYELFYVGTKAYLLSKYQPLDMEAYLREHQGACSGKSK